MFDTEEMIPASILTLVLRCGRLLNSLQYGAMEHCAVAKYVGDLRALLQPEDDYYPELAKIEIKWQLRTQLLNSSKEELRRLLT